MQPSTHTYSIRIEAALPFDPEGTRNPFDDIDNPDGLWTYVLTCAARAGLTVLTSQVHRFVGGGITGTAILAESSLALHTWPEDSLAIIEATTCGSSDITMAFAWLLATTASHATVEDSNGLRMEFFGDRVRRTTIDRTVGPWSEWSDA